MELEVVVLRAVLIIAADDLTLRHALGKHDALVIIGDTCEDLVRLAIKQTDEGDPLLFIILEAHDVSL